MLLIVFCFIFFIRIIETSSRTVNVLCDDWCTGIYVNGVRQVSSEINLSLTIKNHFQKLYLDVDFGSLITVEVKNENGGMGIIAYTTINNLNYSSNLEIF